VVGEIALLAVDLELHLNSNVARRKPAIGQRWWR
jgi:hypothetical protein